MISTFRHPTRRAICTIAASVVLGLLWSLASYCNHLHRPSTGPATTTDAPCSLCMHMERLAGPSTAVTAIVPVIAAIVLPRALGVLPVVRRLQFRSYLSRAPPAL